MTDAERIANLERVIEELQRKLADAERRSEGQAEEIGKLRREVEEWRRGHRERRHRRTSGSEGAPGATAGPRRKRGRPERAAGSNRPIPKDVDRTEKHEAPEVCRCGSAEVEPTGEMKRTIVQDIPPVKVENVEHVTPVVRCTKCKREWHARLPGMSADGQATTHVQVGPGVIALIESLRFEHKVALRGISSFLAAWFAVKLSSGGVSQLLARAAEQNRPAVDEIEAAVQGARVAGADETGLREDGHGAYVWLVHTPNASLFRVERSRGAWVIDEMLGNRFIGVLITDFYAAYTRNGLPWTPAFCGGHLVREAKKLAEVTPSPTTISFSKRLSSLYAWGLKAQSSGEEGLRDCVVVGLHDLASDETLEHNSDVARLQARILARFAGITRFLDRPDVPMTNNWTEREIRFLATYRKVTGGTRSESGSETLGHHLTITRTLAKNDLALRPWVTEAYWAHVRGQRLPSVFRSPAATS